MIQSFNLSVISTEYAIVNYYNFQFCEQLTNIQSIGCSKGTDYWSTKQCAQMLAEETKDEEKDAEGPAGGRSLFTPGVPSPMKMLPL